jgi:hypothetical protein
VISLDGRLTALRAQVACSFTEPLAYDAAGALADESVVDR